MGMSWSGPLRESDWATKICCGRIRACPASGTRRWRPFRVVGRENSLNLKPLDTATTTEASRIQRLERVKFSLFWKCILKRTGNKFSIGVKRWPCCEAAISYYSIRLPVDGPMSRYVQTSLLFNRKASDLRMVTISWNRFKFYLILYTPTLS